MPSAVLLVPSDAERLTANQLGLDSQIGLMRPRSPARWLHLRGTRDSLFTNDQPFAIRRLAKREHIAGPDPDITKAEPFAGLEVIRPA